jgi:hypothetical protein
MAVFLIFGIAADDIFVFYDTWNILLFDRIKKKETCFTNE